MLEFSPVQVSRQEAAKISIGALRTKSCFRFDFTSFRVGCASTKDNCKFNVTGLSWDDQTQTEMTAGSLTFNTRACLDRKECDLIAVAADESANLTNLTSLLVDVTAGGQQQKWWADDVTLTWTDASCKAAVCRSDARDTVPKRGRRHGRARIIDAHN